MKRLFWFIVLLPGILSAQSEFDFEEGSLDNWIQSPPDRWEISAEGAPGGARSLHHAFDNPAAGCDQIAYCLNYPGPEERLSLSFRIRHGYPPSSGNNWQVFFLSSRPNAPESTDEMAEAMLLGVNYRGSDDIVRLWEVHGERVTEIVNTGLNYEKSIGREVAPHFMIQRSVDGYWEVFCDTTGVSGELVSFGTGRESGFCSGKYLGVRYAYSSAQDRKLWVDDIRAEGTFFEDTSPPGVDSVTINGLNTLTIHLNEPVEPSPSAHFDVGGAEPDSVAWTGRWIQLRFQQNFPDREEQYLLVGRLEDAEGNVMGDTVIAFTQQLVVFGAIVINELMTDPEPEVYLPPNEYVELFNRSESVVDLTGWSMEINSKIYFLDTMRFPPGDYLLLTPEDAVGAYGDAVTQGILTSSTALTNGGGVLRLYDRYHRLIHTLRYEEMSRYDKLKSEGGWSLERIDPDHLCGGDENWRVSVDWQGGTPGKENSVAGYVPDPSAPEILFPGLSDSATLQIHFSEAVFITPEEDWQPIIQPNRTGHLLFETIPLADRMVEIAVETPFLAGEQYTIWLENLSDCRGNLMTPKEVVFEVPVIPSGPGILINEVMYDPFTGGTEYFELYNHSQEFIDLRDLAYSINEFNEPVSGVNWISDDSHLLAPGSFVAVTPDGALLRSSFDLPWDVDVVESVSWRTLPNEGATLTLLNRGWIELDRMHYSDGMHHDLLADPSGVSLERIAYDDASDNRSNWCSASSSAGYGTPGVQNSCRLQEAEGNLMAEIIPSVFSPDMDGYEDILEIVMHQNSAGALLNIFITDLNGNIVREVVSNGISGSGDRFLWDGHDAQHRLVIPGIYMVHIRVHQEGRVSVIREPCAVIWR